MTITELIDQLTDLKLKHQLKDEEVQVFAGDHNIGFSVDLVEIIIEKQHFGLPLIILSS